MAAAETIDIHGFCDERFAPLKEAFAANFADGLEIGASLAATERGKLVVDLWAGYADPKRTRPWEADTIVELASTTKLVAALSILVLVDRGQVGLDEPVARYWPEFAQGGKEHVTVRQAITHQGGVPGFDSPISPAIACDWGAVTARLAAEPHWYGGEPRLCYHAFTYGFLIGEIIRRVDGRGPRQFFNEEIASRVGADFQIGLASREDLARMARVAFGPGAFTPSGETVKLMSSIDLGPVLSGAFDTWTWLSRVDPAGSGVSNGRALARLGSVIACNGEVDGVRILSPGIVAEATKEQANAQCPLMGWLRMGLGFALDSKEWPAPTPTTVHWGGTGGSWMGMDPAVGVSIGYAPNNWAAVNWSATAPKVKSMDALAEFDKRLARILTAMATVLPTL